MAHRFHEMEPRLPFAPTRRLVASSLGAALLAPLSKARAQGPQQQPLPEGYRLLEARAGAMQLRPEPKPKTAIWGFDGAAPGPLIRVKQGEEIRIRLKNGLQQPTSLHWHGIRVPNAMDGAAGLTQAPVAPGAGFDYAFTAKDAGFSWYHPLVQQHLPEQLERGLYGVVIVDEKEPPTVDRDILAVIDDWRVDPEGVLAADFANPQDGAEAGRLGNFLTVNSLPKAIEDTLAPGSRLRLRLLNASNARIHRMKLDGATARIVAVDGQPSNTAFGIREGLFQLPPGARFEFLVDLPAEEGKTFQLTSLLGQGGAAQAGAAIVTVKTAGAKRAPLPPVAPLPSNGLPLDLDLARAQRVTMLIEGGAAADGKMPPAGKPVWTVNGAAPGGFSGKPLFSAKRGAVVVLAFTNKSQWPQVMHWHGHHARVLFNFDDGWDPFWQDTVLIAPGATARIAFIADNPGKWALHSAIAEHFAAGLATWFEVG